ncbi:MAG TPA: hypothetical protein VFI25_00160 [Planctomycetota bacterium]|nr:hypothetical protein [Planctomycetota bacterium]
MKNLLVALLPVAALAACGPSREEFDEAKAGAAKARADLDRRSAEVSKLTGDLSAAARARDEAAKKAADLETKAGALEKDLAAARSDAASKQAALDAALKEKAAAAEELTRAKTAAAAGEKRAADAGERVRALESSLRVREDEAAKARAEAAEAAEKVRSLEAAAPAARPSDEGSRLSSAATEEVPPCQVLPITFQAKKGERLVWVWSITAAPADLGVDVLDFSISGPDRTKAHGVLAGVEKKGDEGTLEIPADGRWTIVWSNRHPAAKFTVRYEVSLKPAS